jgi:hypothetical protein
VYLDRNCIFEPVQSADPAAVTARATGEVAAAWERGEAAVVEAHRVNFAHLDHQVPRRGRAELDQLLGDLAGARPLFLVDQELAQLHRRGTSVCARGPRIVVRNLTRSRRLVVVPGAILASAARFADPDGERPRTSGVVTLGPGETRVLRPAALIEP